VGGKKQEEKIANGLKNKGQKERWKSTARDNNRALLFRDLAAFEKFGREKTEEEGKVGVAKKSELREKSYPGQEGKLEGDYDTTDFVGTKSSPGFNATGENCEQEDVDGKSFPGLGAEKNRGSRATVGGIRKGVMKGDRE